MGTLEVSALSTLKYVFLVEEGMRRISFIGCSLEFDFFCYFFVCRIASGSLQGAAVVIVTNYENLYSFFIKKQFRNMSFIFLPR